MFTSIPDTKTVHFLSPRRGDVNYQAHADISSARKKRLLLTASLISEELQQTQLCQIHQPQKNSIPQHFHLKDVVSHAHTDNSSAQQAISCKFSKQLVVDLDCTMVGLPFQQLGPKTRIHSDCGGPQETTFLHLLTTSRKFVQSAFCIS